MKFKVFWLLALIGLTGCVSNFREVSYATWRGSEVYPSGSGAVQIVDGVELWVDGTPDKPYRVVGVATASVIDNGSIFAKHAKATLPNELVKHVRSIGADAILMRSSRSEVVGRNAMSLGGASGSSGAGWSSIFASAFTQSWDVVNRESNAALIKYLTPEETRRLPYLLLRQVKTDKISQEVFKKQYLYPVLKELIRKQDYVLAVQCIEVLEEAYVIGANDPVMDIKKRLQR